MRIEIICTCWLRATNTAETTVIRKEVTFNFTNQLNVYWQRIFRERRTSAQKLEGSLFIKKGLLHLWHHLSNILGGERVTVQYLIQASAIIGTVQPLFKGRPYVTFALPSMLKVKHYTLSTDPYSAFASPLTQCQTSLTQLCSICVRLRGIESLDVAQRLSLACVRALIMYKCSKVDIANHNSYVTYMLLVNKALRFISMKECFDRRNN